MINWKVRIRNKLFWLTIIPATIVFVQTVLNAFGISFDLTNLQNTLLELVESAFIVLALLGIVIDPTTEGIKDSDNALTYTKPKK